MLARLEAAARSREMTEMTLRTETAVLEEAQSCAVTGEDASSDDENEAEDFGPGRPQPGSRGNWLHAASVQELRSMIIAKGGGRLLDSRASISYDMSALRTVLTDLIRSGPTAQRNSAPVELVDAFMGGIADRWPTDELAPPANAEEAMDLDGPWGPAARGVEIRLCEEPGKGMGVFATHDICEGYVVAVYWGEQLSQREFNLRHGWKIRGGGSHAPPSAAEAGELAERQRRLDALVPGCGAPIGGAQNGGSYCFSLLPEEFDYGDDRPAYIDAEDPHRSSWARYINHCDGDDNGCNLVSQTDVTYQRVWFQARRAIRTGEELCFSYQGDGGEPLIVPWEEM